ncbi:MAG: DUF305 domain-containing protein [Helicobacteraceae bacterium]|nr:DUF305 domain-containing protein [Helicobacteraceae bacterium]
MKYIFLIPILALTLQANPHNSQKNNLYFNENEQMTMPEEISINQQILDAMNAPMQGTSMSCNINNDFLSDMIPHHQGAINSSKLYLQVGKDKDLKKIANDIIKSQEQEIEYFNELLEIISQEEKINCEDLSYQNYQMQVKEDMDKMMSTMHAVQISDNIDLDFAKAMIAHHQGAIDSSKSILKFTQNPQIQEIANNIIKTQEQEIAAMNKIISSK